MDAVLCLMQLLAVVACSETNSSTTTTVSPPPPHASKIMWAGPPNVSSSARTDKGFYRQNGDPEQSYEFVYQQNNENQSTARLQEAKGGAFKVKVVWQDKGGNSGEHQWEYQHLDQEAGVRVKGKFPPPTSPPYTLDVQHPSGNTLKSSSTFGEHYNNPAPPGGSSTGHGGHFGGTFVNGNTNIQSAYESAPVSNYKTPENNGVVPRTSEHNSGKYFKGTSDVTSGVYLPTRQHHDSDVPVTPNAGDFLANLHHNDYRNVEGQRGDVNYVVSLLKRPADLEVKLDNLVSSTFGETYGAPSDPMRNYTHAHAPSAVTLARIPPVYVDKHTLAIFPPPRGNRKPDVNEPNISKHIAFPGFAGNYGITTSRPSEHSETQHTASGSQRVPFHTEQNGGLGRLQSTANRLNHQSTAIHEKQPNFNGALLHPEQNGGLGGLQSLPNRLNHHPTGPHKQQTNFHATSLHPEQNGGLGGLQSIPNSLNHHPTGPNEQQSNFHEAPLHPEQNGGLGGLQTLPNRLKHHPTGPHKQQTNFHATSLHPEQTGGLEGLQSTPNKLNHHPTGPHEQKPNFHGTSLYPEQNVGLGVLQSIPNSKNHHSTGPNEQQSNFHEAPLQPEQNGGLEGINSTPNRLKNHPTGPHQQQPNYHATPLHPEQNGGLGGLQSLPNRLKHHPTGPHGQQPNFHGVPLQPEQNGGLGGHQSPPNRLNHHPTGAQATFTSQGGQPQEEGGHSNKGTLAEGNHGLSYVTKDSTQSFQGNHGTTNIRPQHNGPLVHTGIQQQHGPLVHNNIPQHHGPLVHTGQQQHGPLVHNDSPQVHGPSVHTGQQQNGPLVHNGNSQHNGPLVHNGNPQQHGTSVHHNNPQQHGPSVHTGQQQNGPLVHNDNSQHNGPLVHNGNPQQHGHLVNNGIPHNVGPLVHNGNRQQHGLNTDLQHNGPLVHNGNSQHHGSSVHNGRPQHNGPVVGLHNGNTHATKQQPNVVNNHQTNLKDSRENYISANAQNILVYGNGKVNSATNTGSFDQQKQQQQQQHNQGGNSGLPPTRGYNSDASLANFNAGDNFNTQHHNSLGNSHDNSIGNNQVKSPVQYGGSNRLPTQQNNGVQIVSYVGNSNNVKQNGGGNSLQNYGQNRQIKPLGDYNGRPTQQTIATNFANALGNFNTNNQNSQGNYKNDQHQSVVNIPYKKTLPSNHRIPFENQNNLQSAQKENFNQNDGGKLVHSQGIGAGNLNNKRPTSVGHSSDSQQDSEEGYKYDRPVKQFDLSFTSPEDDEDDEEYNNDSKPQSGSGNGYSQNNNNNNNNKPNNALNANKNLENIITTILKNVNTPPPSSGGNRPKGGDSRYVEINRNPPPPAIHQVDADNTVDTPIAIEELEDIITRLLEPRPL